MCLCYIILRNVLLFFWLTLVLVEIYSVHKEDRQAMTSCTTSNNCLSCSMYGSEGVKLQEPFAITCFHSVQIWFFDCRRDLNAVFVVFPKFFFFPLSFSLRKFIQISSWK